MDAVACDLINEAWELFQGHEPAAVLPTTRQDALAALTEELGYTESPPGSNNNMFGQWYGMNYQPWCAMAVTWAYEEGAGGSPSFAKGQRYSYVPYIVSDAQNLAHGLSVTQDPIPGDLVCYDWSYDTIFDHVGLFECWLSLTDFQAIEGNTSTSSNSNGGQVQRRKRSTAAQKTVFIRVEEP